MGLKSEDVAEFALSIMDTIRESLLILDKDLMIIGANRHFYKTFKLSETEIEKTKIYDIGNGFWNIPDMRVLLENIIPLRTSFENYKIKIPIEDTGERILVINARKVQRKNGYPPLILLAIEDNFSQESIEKCYRKPKEYYLDFVEDLNSIIIRIDRNGRITFFNRFSEETFGYSRKEITGKQFIGKIVPLIESGGKDNRELSQGLFSDPARYFANENEGIRKDGSRIRFTWNTKALYDKNCQISEILINGNDITKLASARKSVEHKSAILDAIMEFSPVGIMLADKNGIITNVNMAQRKTLKLANDEIIGKEEQVENWGILDTVSHQTPQHNSMPMYKAIWKNDVIIDEEYLLKRNGKLLNIAISAAPILKENIVAGVITIWQNITEYKKIENQLRNERELFQSIFQNIPVMITLYYPQLRKFEVNKAFEQITGWTQTDIKKQNPMELVYPDPAYRQKVAEYMQSLTPGFKDFHIRTKNGKTIETSWANVRIADGRQVGIGIDISERKRAEQQILEWTEELQRSNNFINAILQTSGALILVIDRNSRIVRFNKACEELTGYNADEIRNINVMNKLVPEHERKGTQEVMHRLLSGELLVEHENHWLTRNGESRFIRWRNTVLFDSSGKPSHAISTGIDISDRKQAQAQREELIKQIASEQDRLQTILHQLPAGVLIADNSGKLIYINKYIINLFGEQYTNKSLESYLQNWNPCHLDGKPFALEEIPMHRAVKGITTTETEMYFRHINGKNSLFTEVNGIPVFDSEGRVKQGIVTMIDITKRKQVENELKQRTEELISANKDLESFSYSVSHDLRSPLSIINGLSEILLEDYAEKLGDEGQGYLKKIISSTLQAQQLINDVLNLSRIGRQEIKRENIDLSAMVSRFLAELQADLPQRKTRIVVQPDVQTYADPRMLHVAIENLLRNAWKFTSKKDVTFIQFGVEFFDKEKVYFIRDNGAGFDMKFAKVIFEPFKRVHSENHFRGTGVGLSIVARVISRHGGKIWAESEKEKGTVFYFTL